MKHRLAFAFLVVVLIASACAIPATGTIALDDVAAVDAGDSVEISLLVNDRPPWGENIRIVSIDGEQGTVREIPNGRIVYTAPDDLSGEDRFRYTIESDSGSTATAEVVVMVGQGTTTTTTTTTTTEPPPPGDPVLVLPDEIHFGEVFVTEPATRVFVAFAERGDFSIGPADHGDLQVEPAPECLQLAEGTECEIAVTWTPQMPIPAPLNRSIPIVDDATLLMTGLGVPSLVFEPPHQTIETGGSAASFVDVESTLVNVSNSPVTLTRLVYTDEIEVDFGRCSRLLVNDALPPQMPCLVTASVDVSSIPSGMAGDRSIGVEYGEFLVEAFFTFVRPDAPQPPEPPVWVRPVPGQGLWHELVVEGFGVEWEPVPGAVEYSFTAQVCWDADVTCEPLFTDSPTQAQFGFVVTQDPGRFFETYFSVVEAGIKPTLVLTVTAYADTDTGELLGSAPSELIIPLELPPFAVLDVDFSPPFPADLACGLDRLSSTVRLVSFLLDEVDFFGYPFEEIYNVDFGDPISALVAPGPEDVSVEVSFVGLQETVITFIEFELGGIVGHGEGVDYVVFGCGGPPVLSIDGAEFDAPDNDNENPNGEWISIINTGELGQDMTYWTLEDEGPNYVYTFPPGFTLSPGSAVTVHTGPGVDTSTTLYWGLDHAVWNNDYDVAQLYDAAHNEVDYYIGP